ncbi:MAG TPA: hypothetical protein VJ761_20555 [Ktedonobacteraceae bacterium]|nr:hypothetical protein [Ktedonobacteraceae bacterium]
MNMVLQRKQMLVIVLVLLSLLVATLVVLHGAAPGIWHALVTNGPDTINRYH